MLQHNFECQLHEGEGKLQIKHICFQKDCPTKGLICLSCLKQSHSNHTTIELTQYFSQIKSHQGSTVTDADTLKLKQAYQSLLRGLEQMKQNYLQTFSSFETNISEQQSKYLSDLEQQRSFQRDQAKYFNLLENAASFRDYSQVMLQLINLMNENKVFERYETIKDFIPKVIKASNNFQSETPKIEKDLSAYFRQLTKYMTNQNTNQSNQSSQIQLQSSVQQNSVQNRRIQSSDMRTFDSANGNKLVFQYPSVIIEKNTEENAIFYQSQSKQQQEVIANSFQVSQRDPLLSDRNQGINDIMPYQRNQNFFKDKNIFTHNMKTRLLQQKQKNQNEISIEYQPNQNLKALLNIMDQPPSSSQLYPTSNQPLIQSSMIRNSSQQQINSQSQKIILQTDFQSQQQNPNIYDSLGQLGNSQNIYSVTQYFFINFFFSHKQIYFTRRIIIRIQRLSQLRVKFNLKVEKIQFKLSHLRHSKQIRLMMLKFLIQQL